MPNNNFTNLENAIYNSIPRLRELSSGCVIEHEKTRYVLDNYNAVLINNNEIHIEDLFKIIEPQEYQILGHPILLNDVLEWLIFLDKKGIYAIDCSGLLFDSKAKKIGNWNLPKPKLSDQSQELIDALTELIPK